MKYARTSRLVVIALAVVVIDVVAVSDATWAMSSGSHRSKSIGRVVIDVVAVSNAAFALVSVAINVVSLPLLSRTIM